MDCHGFIDGVFDGYHYGHANALFQAKKMCTTLHAATHSDKEVECEKQKVPLYCYNDRYTLIGACKFIDVLHPETKYKTDIKVLDDIGCSVFFNGDKDNNLEEIKSQNRLLLYNRTSNISTTILENRIHDYDEGIQPITNIDYVYLRYIFDSMREYLGKPDYTKVVILRHACWDRFGMYHLKIINDTISRFPDHAVHIDLEYSQEPIVFNKLELAITLLSIKGIDHVVHKYNPNDYDNHVYHYTMCTLETPKKLMPRTPVVPDNHYYRILDLQFKSILLYLESLSCKFTEKDIIVFDIDEVCLCNLMYHGMTIESFGNKMYNYDNGMLPIIEQCRKVFEYIHRSNIKYSFITGRREYIRSVTVQNLKMHGFDRYIDLYLCENDSTVPVEEYKVSCRNVFQKTII